MSIQGHGLGLEGGAKGSGLGIARGEGSSVYQYQWWMGRLNVMRFKFKITLI